MVAGVSPPFCTTPPRVAKVRPLHVYLSSVFTRHQDGEDNERSLDLPLPPVAGILTLLKSDLQTFVIKKKMIFRSQVQELLLKSFFFF